MGFWIWFRERLCTHIAQRSERSFVPLCHMSAPCLLSLWKYVSDIPALPQGGRELNRVISNTRVPDSYGTNNCTFETNLGTQNLRTTGVCHRWYCVGLNIDVMNVMLYRRAYNYSAPRGKWNNGCTRTVTFQRRNVFTALLSSVSCGRHLYPIVFCELLFCVVSLMPRIHRFQWRDGLILLGSYY